MNQEAARNAVTMYMEEGDSEELRAIVIDIMPEWAALFARKNADYGSGSSFELGVRGQYSDIHRKMIKLKRSMWDGEDLAFEDEEEVIMDLISHLFLTLYMKQKAAQVEREHAYSDMSTDEFLDDLIEKNGGPRRAKNLAGALGADLANRLVSRCGALERRAEAWPGEDRRQAIVDKIGALVDAEIPVMVKGDEIEVSDQDGKSNNFIIHDVAGSPFRTGGEIRIELKPVGVSSSQAKWMFLQFSSDRRTRTWEELDRDEKQWWRDKVAEHDRVGQLTAFTESDAEQNGL